MVRLVLAAGSIALVLAGSPATAEQSPAPGQPTPQDVDRSLVGLPVFSSDGQKLGEVSDVGMIRGEPAIRAEMGQFLGLGSSVVIVPAKTFQRKADRIEIAMTADEIRQTISQQRKEREDKQQ